MLLPATVYDTRHKQIDLRFGRSFRAHDMRATLNLLVFNALNASPVLTRNNTIGQAPIPGTYPASQRQQADGGYNSLWVPTSILQPRFATLSVTLDF